MFSLLNGDTIITAWGENCDGPGWANTPIFVLIYNAFAGRHRVECLQPNEQTPAMVEIFPFSALVNDKLKKMVGSMVKVHVT